MFEHWSRLLRRPHHRRLFLLARLAIVSLAMAAVASCAAINIFPGLAAQAAEALRVVVGDQPVAQLETTVYQVQDSIQRLAYRLGASQPSSPWATTPLAGLAVTPAAPASAATAAAISVAPASTAILAPLGTPAARAATPPPAATAPPGASAAPSPARWTPLKLTALGTLAGEGQWAPYLQSPSGQTVAYRAFLQPDPQRPYAVVAIVAFNLNATRLKFVLGTDEPFSPVAVYRPGRIPPADLQSGLLLAAFNGGFRARHGYFGAMVDGVTVLSPRAGLGTVAMYADGRVRIGAWGTDIIASRNILAWRQNGPLILNNGQVNPRTAVDAPRDWGYTLNGATAVWRSGLAISADDSTLYYLAGPHLTLPAMATAMSATHADQGIQLDINSYWVHFNAVQPGGTQPLATPLLDTMSQSINRYLGIWSRDFFYVMAAPPLP